MTDLEIRSPKISQSPADPHIFVAEPGEGWRCINCEKPKKYNASDDGECR